MKLQLFAATALLLASNLAMADRHLVCAAGSPRLVVTLMRHSTYIPYDSLNVSENDGSVVQALLEAGEDSLVMSESNLTVGFAPGACDLKPAGANILASCVRNSNAGLQIDTSSVSFTATTKTPSGTEEQISISRHLEVLSAALTLTIVDGKSDLNDGPSKRVRSDLIVVANVAGTVRTVRLSRDEGEWTDRTDRSDWDRCVIQD